MTDGVVYVYAVGDAGLVESAPSSLTGVDTAPVRLVLSGELAAVVSTVDADRFSEESLRASLEDLGWLERTARAHHAVVDTIARAHPLAPVRLATVYLDDDNVRRLLDDQRPAFGAALDRIRGRQELGVKAFAGPRAAPAAGGGAGGPGTAYLTRRRAERDSAARDRRRAMDAAERLHQGAAPLVAASRRYPPQDPRLTGRVDEMVLNVAYLVDASGAEALRALVRDWDDPDLRVELTGPWAPYSFATLEEP